jgi:hypothetical protein
MVTPRRLTRRQVAKNDGFGENIIQSFTTRRSRAAL